MPKKNYYDYDYDYDYMINVDFIVTDFFSYIINCSLLPLLFLVGRPTRAFVEIARRLAVNKLD